MTKLSIDTCSRHNYFAISFGGDNAGTRVTPSKCCGSWSWTTMKSWDMKSTDWDNLIAEAKLCKREALKAERKAEKEARRD